MFEDSSDLQPERASSVSDIKIDVTDDEIKKLSEYFQKSREEFQKVTAITSHQRHRLLKVEF